MFEIHEVHETLISHLINLIAWSYSSNGLCTQTEWCTHLRYNVISVSVANNFHWFSLDCLLCFYTLSVTCSLESLPSCVLETCMIFLEPVLTLRKNYVDSSMIGLVQDSGRKSPTCLNLIKDIVTWLQ